jgi:solute carrier family 25 carnitine/acylcarnitine transporter 20/29
MDLSTQRKIQEYRCSLTTSLIKVMIIQPFDLVRFRIQSSHEHQISIRKLIHKIINKEGLITFLKGSNATAAGVFISSFIQFTSYQAAYKHFLNLYLIRNNVRNNHDIGIFEIINNNKIENKTFIRDYSILCGLSGLLSGIMLSIFTSPIDNIRIKLQSSQNLICVDNRQYKINSTLDCMSNILKHHGIKGFYIAFPVAFLRESIASTIYFATFEYFRSKERLYNCKDLTMLKSFLVGALAGGLNWLITFPIDVVKTKRISDTIEHKNNRIYKNSLDCFKQIWNRYGLRGFYNGFSVVFIRGLIVNGVVLTSFDRCRMKAI